MKRTMSDVVGRPLRRDYRLDVAGRSGQSSVLDVASYREAFSPRIDDSPGLDDSWGFDDPMGTAESDAELMADFADFMSGGSEFEDGELPPPDPHFREQLRRRLWRTHVVVNLRDGGDTH